MDNVLQALSRVLLRILGDSAANVDNKKYGSQQKTPHILCSNRDAVLS